MKLVLALFLLLSCLSLSKASVNPMDGLWVAVNPHGDLTKLYLSKDKGDLSIQAWNLNRPWGPEAVTYYLTNGNVPDRALAIWERPVTRIVLTLKLSLDGDHMSVEEFTSFKGNAAGPNKVTEIDFVRPRN